MIQQVLSNRQESLLGLRDIYHYSTDVNHEEFALATLEIMERKPGFVALLWAPKIIAGQRDYLPPPPDSPGAETREIYHLKDGKKVASATATTRFPVAYVAPHGVIPCEGLDVSSLIEPTHFETMAASGQICLLPAPDVFLRDMAEVSSMLVMPVYGNCVPREKTERLATLRGYIIAIADPAVLLERGVGHFPEHGLDVMLVEQDANHRLRVLHQQPVMQPAPVSPQPPDAAGGFAMHQTLSTDTCGSQWLLWTRPSSSWLSEQRTLLYLITGGLGLLATGLLTFFMRGVFLKTALVEAVVTQRTTELMETQRQLRDDILQRTRTEQSLKASEERYRILISQSTDAIWLLEIAPPVAVKLPAEQQLQQILENSRIAECNTPAAHGYGHIQPSGVIRRDLAYFAPRSQQRLRSVLLAFLGSGYHLADYEAWDRSQGENRVFQHNLIGVIEDEHLTRIWITERELTQQRQLEQERQLLDRKMADTQRLESLGVLAGGIAHDFNNLLTAILGHASLGRAEIPSDSPLDAHFAQIEAASSKAANLCQQMLAYAGKGRFVIKPHDISQMVKDSAQLLQTSINGTCALQFLLGENLPEIMADSIQIQQILNNLVLNAAEAITSRDGQITISTGMIHPDETTFNGCIHAPASPVGTYVYLTVTDNGPGMDAATLSRIFEPFYTTKFTGRGLGLPATLGIVRSHQGALRVESQKGHGSAFTLFLPAVEPGSTETQKSESNTPWEANGTLLIIDDEPPVRMVAERMARSLGFGTLSAENGAQAVELFGHYQNGIQAALVDLSMPGLSGEETMRKLRVLSPTISLVAMSGYNPPDSISIEGLQPLFLPKPFSMAQFQSVVRKATKTKSTARDASA